MVPWNLDKRFVLSNPDEEPLATCSDHTCERPIEQPEDTAKRDRTNDTPLAWALEVHVIQRYCDVFKQGEFKKLVDLAGNARVTTKYCDEPWSNQLGDPVFAASPRVAQEALNSTLSDSSEKDWTTSGYVVTKSRANVDRARPLLPSLILRVSSALMGSLSRLYPNRDVKTRKRARQRAVP
ncbi:hypothetical protein PsorP6_005050 [Peronosclerospora sorghi]|uniref:Uncharacterized protein n=1 Tax=Peronosclerospora sorghi TaxID=230839 RepID=A0ACC0W1K9_9STRA|nr:hypothetical protein PsorP6_005050 [Peronosclerospora sorghi]